MLLYDSAVSGNAYKIRLLLAHLGVSYERRPVDVVDRKNPRDELADQSPTRRVPTIVLDDGRPLSESGAILWHLGEGTRFVPEDPYDRALVLQWMFFEQSFHEPAIAVARFIRRFSGYAEQLTERLGELTKRGQRALGVMERHLERNEFFVGGALTLADIALYAYTHNADEGGFDLAPYPAIRAWLERVASEPGHVAIDA